MKRILDVIVACFGLVIASPVLILFSLLIWLQDFRSPLYIAKRASGRGTTFRMYKLRSMIVAADQAGGSSTAGDDCRVTRVGKLVRRFKLDEFTQLANVLKGDMSLVGPRPQDPRHCDLLYTEEEFRLFEVKPGITDISSIVFSDEGIILEGAENPDLRYNQVIRPWKSRLGLFYVDNRDLLMDAWLVTLTVIGLFSRRAALQGVQVLLRRYGADSALIEVSNRQGELKAFPPPGMSEIEMRS